MTGRMPAIRGRHARRTNPIRRASAGLSPARAGAMLGILLAGAALYGVGASDAFGYQRLEIEPTRYTDEAALRLILDVPVGTNLFELQTEPLAERIRELPTVRDARVEVSLPDTLIVRVIEREPILIWRIGEAAYLVDPDGVLFTTLDESTSDAAAGLPSIADDRPTSAAALRVGALLDPVDFDAARRLVGLVPSDIGSVASALTVTITSASGFVVSTRPGTWVAVFGFYTPTLRTTELIPGQVRLLRSLLADRESDVERIILASDTNGTYIARPTPRP